MNTRTNSKGVEEFHLGFWIPVDKFNLTPTEAKKILMDGPKLFANLKITKKAQDILQYDKELAEAIEKW